MAIEELQEGRYHHSRLLGSGGMGDVYLMEDTRVSRQVAIKVVRAEDPSYTGTGSEKTMDASRLFLREARAIAALEHPNILPLYDFGEETREDITITYMVMPYCADGSLESWLRQRGGELLPPQKVAYLIEQAAEALQYAHEHKVIHLDVKPSNFLLRSNRKDPDSPMLLLADFGIARNFTTVSSSSRTIRGTPTTMAPEQWSGNPVFASDQYALAVMAYELLVGRPPFSGSMEQLMYHHFTIRPQPPSKFNPRLPAALDEVMLRALAKKPEERFPSIVDFATALTEAASQPAVVSEKVAKEDVATYATLAISQEEADAGLSQLLTLVDGETITVSIPAGVRDGQVIRQPLSPGSAEQAGVVLVNIAIREPDALQAAIHAKPRAETPPDNLQPVRLSASDHNRLTVTTFAPEVEITEGPLPMPPRRRRLGVVALISLLVVLLLIGGLVYFYASRQPVSTAGPAQQSHTTPVIQATRIPTALPSPTAGPGEYIAGRYNGTMTDTTTGQTTTLAVVVTQTRGSGALGGSVTFNSSAQQAYSLSGIIDTQGNFFFTVPQPSGQQPFYFHGGVQPGSYLHGNYCRTNAGSCKTDIGYFTVGPRY